MSKKVKGIYKDRKRWRVRKYGYHVGTYDTKEEAIEAALKVEQEQVRFRYMQQYIEARDWLREHGELP